MKILLIAPASGKWRHVGRHRWFNGKTFRFSLLSLLSVAAESPADAEIRIVDEQIDEVPWDADVNLVGITCMTALAPRAYEIARHFRGRRIPSLQRDILHCAMAGLAAVGTALHSLSASAVTSISHCYTRLSRAAFARHLRRSTMLSVAWLRAGAVA